MGQRGRNIMGTARVKEYPTGLLEVMDLNGLIDTPIDYGNLTEDQMEGLEYALTQLRDKIRNVIERRFKDRMTFAAIGNQLGVSTARVSDMLQEGIYHLTHDVDNVRYISKGYSVHKQFLENEKKLTHRKRWTKFLQEHPEGVSTRLSEIKFPRYTCVKLDKAGIETLEQLIALVQNEDWYEQIPTSNPAWAQRVIVVLLSIGAIDEDCIGCKIKGNSAKSAPIQVRSHIYKCWKCNDYFQSYRKIRECRNCGYSLRSVWVYEDMEEYYRRREEEMLQEENNMVVAEERHSTPAAE